MIMSSSPPNRRWPLGTRRGVNEPPRSRGTSSSIGPTSDSTVFGVVPLRELACFDASEAPFSYPRWPVSSACRPRSSAALTSAGTNPPSPVSSTFPASICSNRASSCPEAFNCSTRSWPVGSSGFFSSVMVMILTVPLGTAYTDHLTRPVAAAQQQFPQPVAGAHQVPSGIVTRTDQIADGLLAESRDPHGSDVVIASQSGQQYRVAAIGLDPLARWPQQFRGGCDLDRMTRLCQEAGKSEAGGASLVRDPQRAMITSEALDELADHDQVIRKSLLDQLAR